MKCFESDSRNNPDGGSASVGKHGSRGLVILVVIVAAALLVLPLLPHRQPRSVATDTAVPSAAESLAQSDSVFVFTETE